MEVILASLLILIVLGILWLITSMFFLYLLMVEGPKSQQYQDRYDDF
jgi:hypothetical protein